MLVFEVLVSDAGVPVSRPRFELYASKDALDWRWRLRASNGEVLASGEGYSSKAHAKRGAAAVVASARVAEVREVKDDGP